MITPEMWDKQARFLESQMPKYPKDPRLLHLIFTTHLAHEVHELMDTVPWKLHRVQRPMRRTDLVEEAVDCAKLLINVLLLHGVTQEEFQRMFHDKSQRVADRAREEDRNA